MPQNQMPVPQTLLILHLHPHLHPPTNSNTPASNISPSKQGSTRNKLEEEAVVHEIVCLGNSMGLEVDDDDDDVEELVEEHSKELSTEELLELHKEQNETLKQSLTSEESGEEEDKEESRIIPAKDLKDAFFCWSKLSKLAEDYHPDVGSVQKAIRLWIDRVLWMCNTNGPE
ncbi:hypothetical protein Hamer_G000984 [Homarus americanus]|uniref:Uncharacterized protein n=1 Tax=Homarus americanus TaxID=6706 RepID=A0A8J5N2E9_HOMAM|nr:hypothetical protein Hamer_G000984 [Homarus americanus]